MSRCNLCTSYAINPHMCGRTPGKHLDLCDVCYWRKESGQQQATNQRLTSLLLRVKVSLNLDDTEWGYSDTEKYKLLADIRAALSTEEVI